MSLDKKLIESHIDKLHTSLGQIRKSVDEEELAVLYHTKNYLGMVRKIQAILKLDLPVKLLLVNKGGPHAAAWIEMPNPMPSYGSSTFSRTTVEMYIRKSILLDYGFEQVTIAIAHELCHVVLDSIGHPLKREEKAVDLTAMLLGFRDFYLTGCKAVEIQKPSLLERLTGKRRWKEMKYVYLSHEEVSHAANYMTFSKR